MKISFRWLRERVPFRLDVRALADRLTHAGIEIGAIEPVAPALDKVVVGAVMTVNPHPGADRLKCCRVKVSSTQTLDIVCGAANVAAGMRVPVALPGARLPNGTEIRESDIRGQRSRGMLCSAAELGLGDSAEGLLDLGAGARIGNSLTRELELDDYSLEVELTPNRGDCLSAHGLAREIAALTGTALTVSRVTPVTAATRARRSVTIESPQGCPRYAGRVIEGINPAARTPLWMAERLRRSGLRPIHPVVDVTNYVMLELGQPMHAFDLEKISGGIRVRQGKTGERLTLLDGKTVDTGPDTLVIADEAQPLALAGVMGGKDSGVTEATRSIFLESAFFATNAISGRARALGLQSDSSYRFERGVDPALQVIALQRATRLLLGIVGGRAGPVEEKSSARYLPRRTPIRLRLERVARLLGTGLSGQGIVKILKRLGMSVTGKGPVWKVVPPGYRFDIEREEDLIEEIARVHGYTNLPSRLPRMTMTPYAAPEGRLDESRLRHLLVDRDYQEVITYSFVDPAMNQLVDPGSATAVLANPIAADMAVMRTSLWPGLLSVLRHNLNRQQTRVRLFEIGRCFTNAGKAAYRQDKRLGGLVYGSEHAEQWGIPRRPVDYFAAKSDVMALLELTGIPDGFRFQPSNHPALHPGQSAEILASGKHVGLLGLLHPEIRSKLGLEQNTLVFELDIALFASGRVPNFSELSKFPSIRRDLAFIIDENISADRVTTTIKSAVGSLLIDLELFDEYRGKGIDSGRKSLALALTFQHSSRTLKEDEVETEIAKIIRALESQFNAQLRN